MTLIKIINGKTYIYDKSNWDINIPKPISQIIYLIYILKCAINWLYI